MSFKVFDFECKHCDKVFNDVLVDSDKTKCSVCNKVMKKIFCAPKAPERAGRFQPFWSDTLQTRINDREDLQKLRKYAKDNGLINVGHRRMKPDRKAIRYNYEHD